ncbi:MAG: Oxidoreductase involved in sulfite reduction [Herbaspirillum sp.]|jgi:uncharacterized protein (DUF934 family)|nr:Oxidoreductase involved in sulfite reduction [Herbaspirillum sp.]
MSKIIKDRAVVEDDWNVLRLTETDSVDSVAIPGGKVIVPLKVWLAHPELKDRGDIGVWFASDERVEDLQEALAQNPRQFALIAVDFPKFTDGRGYSIGYLLRTRLHYDGELRAIGDVLRDQLFYMQRVGFNVFAVREDKNIDDALKGLTDFSEKYQTSWDEKTPLFRRVHRSAPAQDRS